MQSVEQTSLEELKRNMRKTLQTDMILEKMPASPRKEEMLIQNAHAKNHLAYQIIYMENMTKDQALEIAPLLASTFNVKTQANLISMMILKMARVLAPEIDPNNAREKSVIVNLGSYLIFVQGRNPTLRQRQMFAETRDLLMPHLDIWQQTQLKNFIKPKRKFCIPKVADDPNCVTFPSIFTRVRQDHFSR